MGNWCDGKAHAIHSPMCISHSGSTGSGNETLHRKRRETKHKPGRASCSQQLGCRSISLPFLLGVSLPDAVHSSEMSQRQMESQSVLCQNSKQEISTELRPWIPSSFQRWRSRCRLKVIDPRYTKTPSPLTNHTALEGAARLILDPSRNSTGIWIFGAKATKKHKIQNILLGDLH